MKFLAPFVVAYVLMLGNGCAIERTIWENDEGVQDEGALKYFSSHEQETIRSWTNLPVQLYGTEDLYSLSHASVVPQKFLNGEYGHLKLTQAKYFFQGKEVPQKISMEFSFAALDFANKSDEDGKSLIWEPMLLTFYLMTSHRNDLGCSGPWNAHRKNI